MHGYPPARVRRIGRYAKRQVLVWFCIRTTNASLCGRAVVVWGAFKGMACGVAVLIAPRPESEYNLGGYNMGRSKSIKKCSLGEGCEE